jgi:hypothetical protein
VLDQAEQLAADLGYLPLALSQASAVICNDGITCAGYRGQLADQRQRLAEVFPARPGAAGDEYAHTVAETWSIARDRADVLDPAGLAGPMLDLISLLDPSGIPEAVLTSEPARAWLASHEPADAAQSETAGSEGLSVEQARRALRNLWRLSLITHDPDDPVRSVRVHALTQRAGLEELGAAAMRVVAWAAADALLAVWPSGDTAHPLDQSLRANAEALARHGTVLLWADSRAHSMLFRLGRSWGDAGLVVQARDHFADLSEYAAQVCGPDDPYTLLIRYAMAYWQGEAGDPAGATAATEEALVLMDRVAPDDLVTLSIRNNLIRWQGQAGDPAGAVVKFEQLLADQTRVFGPDDPATLIVRNNLAYSRGEAGDVAGAVAGLEMLCADRERVLGPDHRDTLITRGNLARWWGEAGDVARAVLEFEQLLADQTRALGPDHPDTTTTSTAAALRDLILVEARRGGLAVRLWAGVV